MNRTKYLLKNTAIFAVGNLGSKLINFFLIPIYTAVLSTKQYGVIDIIFTLSSVAIPIINLNIGEAIMRFALDEDVDRNRIMSVGIVVVFLSLISSIILYVIVGMYTTISNYRIYVYFYVVSYGLCDVNICFLRGKEKLLAFSICNIIRTFTIALFNIVFLIVLKRGIAGYLEAYIAANIFTALFAFFAGNVRDVLKHFYVDTKLFKKMIRYSIPLIPTSLMWWITNSSDRLMLAAMLNVSVAGLYAIAAKIPALISLISTIFNQAFSYSAISEDKSEDRVEFNNCIFGHLFSMVTVFGIFVLMILKAFMKIYVSADYYMAWKYAPPLIVGTCLMVLGTFFSVSYTVNKDSMGFLKSGMAGAIVNVILNLKLIPVCGAFGAALATFLSYAVVFLYRYYDIRKYLRLNLFIIKYIVSMIMLITAGVLVYLSPCIHITGCSLLLCVALWIYKDNWRDMFIKLVSLRKNKILG